MAERRIDCPECGQGFNVPGSLKGGIANCPKCRKAVPVGGGPEGLFWLLLLAGIAVAVFFTVIAYLAHGWSGAAVVGGIATAVIVCAVLAS